MRVAELKALVRERGLRGYSRLRKAQIIALLRPAPPTRPIGTLLHLRKRKCNQLGLDQIDRGNQNC